jgi:hypothetical protein
MARFPISAVSWLATGRRRCMQLRGNFRRGVRSDRCLRWQRQGKGRFPPHQACETVTQTQSSKPHQAGATVVERLTPAFRSQCARCYSRWVVEGRRRRLSGSPLPLSLRWPNPSPETWRPFRGSYAASWRRRSTCRRKVTSWCHCSRVRYAISVLPVRRWPSLHDTILDS